MWLSGAGRPDCATCRRVYEIDEESPPCDTCRPLIHPLNAAALKLWEMVQGQWRFSTAGAMALDITAIETALRIGRVPVSERAGLTEQVMLIGDTVIAEIREERQAEEPRRKTR